MVILQYLGRGHPAGLSEPDDTRFGKNKKVASKGFSGLKGPGNKQRKTLKPITKLEKKHGKQPAEEGPSLEFQKGDFPALKKILPKLPLECPQGLPALRQDDDFQVV